MSVTNNLALAYALDGKADKAEELLRKAVASGHEDKRVRQNLALVLGLQGKFDEARQVAVGRHARGRGQGQHGLSAQHAVEPDQGFASAGDDAACGRALTEAFSRRSSYGGAVTTGSLMPSPIPLAGRLRPLPCARLPQLPVPQPPRCKW